MPKGESKKEDVLVSSIKAFIVAPLIFLIVLAAVFAYSGVWPPLVVIESESMQHSDTTSYIGVIDTGDIVVVKDVTGLDDVTSYMEGVATGHSTYGEYGDVVIYHRPGMEKPIIHRAILELEYNFTGGGFDIPALADVPASMWDVPGEEKRWWNLKQSVELHDIGYRNATVLIDLGSMLTYMEARGNPHGGLITMGDHNWDVVNGTVVGKYDQKWISTIREPVRADWIVGKARGELPWFGLLKLWATGTAPADTPQNSQDNLIVALALIIAIPVALDVSNSLLKRRGIELFGWTSRLSLRRVWNRLRRSGRD